MKDRGLLMVMVLVTVSCHYEFAITKPSGLKIEEAFEGSWTELSGAGGEDAAKPKQMTVSPSAQGGAFVDFRVQEGKHWYFRAERLAQDLPGLYQLEFLGDGSGEKPAKNPYTVAFARLEGKVLEWRLVDPRKAGRVEDGEALLEKIRKARDSGTDLSGAVQKFHRSEDVPIP